MRGPVGPEDTAASVWTRGLPGLESVKRRRLRGTEAGSREKSATARSIDIVVTRKVP